MKIQRIDSDMELMNFKERLADLITGPPFHGDPEHDDPLVRKIVTFEWSQWFYVETHRETEFIILIKPIRRPYPFPLMDRIRRFLKCADRRPFYPFSNKKPAD